MSKNTHITITEDGVICSTINITALVDDFLVHFPPSAKIIKIKCIRLNPKDSLFYGKNWKMWFQSYGGFIPLETADDVTPGKINVVVEP